MNNSHLGDDSFEKAAEAGYQVSQKTKKVVKAGTKKLFKEFVGSMTGHEHKTGGPRNYDALTPAHLQKFEQNFEAQDAQKMENLKAILFKHVNEESARAVKEREQEERARLQLMEEEAMRDKQEKDQEQGNGMVTAPQGKVKRNILGGQAKKNTQAETRGGKSQF